jgi:hypothetical protein
MIARVGRRVRLAVQTVIRAARTANDNQVYMWECVLLTSRGAPETQLVRCAGFFASSGAVCGRR